MLRVDENHHAVIARRRADVEVALTLNMELVVGATPRHQQCAWTSVLTVWVKRAWVAERHTGQVGSGLVRPEVEQHNHFVARPALSHARCSAEQRRHYPATDQRVGTT